VLTATEDRPEPDGRVNVIGVPVLGVITKLEPTTEKEYVVLVSVSISVNGAVSVVPSWNVSVSTLFVVPVTVAAVNTLFCKARNSGSALKSKNGALSVPKLKSLFTFWLILYTQPQDDFIQPEPLKV
jgi:hypothetical protein